LKFFIEKHKYERYKYRQNKELKILVSHKSTFMIKALAYMSAEEKDLFTYHLDKANSLNGNIMDLLGDRSTEFSAKVKSKTTSNGCSDSETNQSISDLNVVGALKCTIATEQAALKTIDELF
jgi:hypothetical protein